MKHFSLIAFVVGAVVCPGDIASAYAQTLPDPYLHACTPRPEPEHQGPGAEALAKGREAGNRKDYSEAVLWFRKAADQGDARAKYNIGVLYERGLGVEQNYTEAMRWYRKAADQGDVRAQFNIGGLYHEGRGVEQNYTEAMRWYRKAADQGDVCGQLNVGVAYSKGLGVEQSDTEAMSWFRRAADQGNADAQALVGTLYYSGSGVEQNYGEALRWYRKAADQGHTDAQAGVGAAYLDGRGVAQDEGQARAWMTKAATSGSELAKSWLAAHPAGAPATFAAGQNDIPLCDSKDTEARFIRAENESREGLAGGLRAQALEGARELSFDVRAQKRYCLGIGYYNDGVWAVTYELWRDGRGTQWITVNGRRQPLR
jgi:TPR repeat protein